MFTVITCVVIMMVITMVFAVKPRTALVFVKPVRI